MDVYHQGWLPSMTLDFGIHDRNDEQLVFAIPLRGRRGKIVIGRVITTPFHGEKAGDLNSYKI